MTNLGWNSRVPTEVRENEGKGDLNLRWLRFSIFLIALGVFPSASSEGFSVSGVVIFEGKAPRPRVIDTRTDDDFCEAMYADTPLYADGASIGPKGEFADIFVWIDTPPAGNYPPPESPVLLDQKGCRYTTYVFGMMVGQTLMVRNSDDTTHNVRGFARANRPFNFGQPPGLKPRTRVFKNPEFPLKIKCDVHAWMRSFCFVMEHPFFAVTGEDGSFEIKNVPAGTYILKAWHEKLGELDQEITVADASASKATFTFRRP